MSRSSRVHPSTLDSANERRNVAWLGKSVAVRGDLVSSEDLMIAGEVVGEITVKNHAVVIGPEARIRADILARSVTIHGQVEGHVTAGERVEIGATGNVEGNVTAPRMAMAEGGRVRGKVEVSGRPRSAP